MRTLAKPGKIIFISLRKLFSFSEKSNCRISWHQMPKHKTNTFHWITWEVKTVFWWNWPSLRHITKENKSSKCSTKTAAWKLVPGSFVFAIKRKFYWKMKYLKHATYIKYVIAKLSQFIQITMLTSTESSLQIIVLKLSRVWNWFTVHIFIKIFS